MVEKTFGKMWFWIFAGIGIVFVGLGICVYLIEIAS